MMPAWSVPMPINNVVDITNYIVHAFGQPLHCFDADRIKGGEVIVKTLPEGTPFTTLDGVERKLNGRDLMICNREEPMCIAGVFGGLDSGSTETTKDVFISRLVTMLFIVSAGISLPISACTFP